MRQKRLYAATSSHLSPYELPRYMTVCVINAYYVGCNHIDLSPRDAEVAV